MEKKTKGYQAKIDYLGTLFDEVHVSKRGNYYVRIPREKKHTRIEFTPKNITKNTLGKIGEVKADFFKNDDDIIIATPRGYSVKSPKGFKTLSKWDCVNADSRYLDLFLFNKRCKYLKEYPALVGYNYFHSFTNIEDALEHLGLDMSYEEYLGNIGKIDIMMEYHTTHNLHTMLRDDFVVESKLKPYYLATKLYQTSMFKILQETKELKLVEPNMDIDTDVIENLEKAGYSAQLDLYYFSPSQTPRLLIQEDEKSFSTFKLRVDGVKVTTTIAHADIRKILNSSVLIKHGTPLDKIQDEYWF